MSLNQVSVKSDAATHALEKQLKSDAKYYSKIYLKFIAAATGSDELQREAYDYAVGDFAGDPDAHSTLVHADALDGELGALVTNATIFAIAATTTYYIKGTKLFGGGVIKFRTPTGETPLAPTMSWPAYIQYMETNHPDATAIARQLGIGANRKAKENVIAVMGYLIDQGIINDQLILERYK